MGWNKPIDDIPPRLVMAGLNTWPAHDDWIGIESGKFLEGLELSGNSQEASFAVLAAYVGFLIRIRTSDFPRLVDWRW